MVNTPQIIYMCGKFVGFEILKYLITINAPISKVILAEHDEQLMELIDAMGFNWEIYKKGIQEKMVLEKIKFDWLINAWSPYILSSDFLSLFHKNVNIHPAYVPWGRGNDSAAWIIRNSEPTGASLLKMDNTIDGGKVYSRQKLLYKFPITGKELHQKLEQASINLFKSKWVSIFDGSIKPSIPEYVNGSYHTRKMTNKDRVINLEENKNYLDMINWILAHDFSPNYTAEVIFKEKQYKVTINIEEKI